MPMPRFPSSMLQNLFSKCIEQFRNLFRTCRAPAHFADFLACLVSMLFVPPGDPPLDTLKEIGNTTGRLSANTCLL